MEIKEVIIQTYQRTYLLLSISINSGETDPPIPVMLTHQSSLAEPVPAYIGKRALTGR